MALAHRPARVLRDPLPPKGLCPLGVGPGVRDRHRRRRGGLGAAYTEFLVAFPIVLFCFFWIVELVLCLSASLVLHHAAVRAARAAAVVLFDNPQFYDGEPTGQPSGRRRQDVDLAAALVLKNAPHVENMKLTLPSTPDGDDDRTSVKPTDLVHVRLKAEYRCFLPISRGIVCDVSSGTRSLETVASFLTQGATYGELKPP